MKVPITAKRPPGRPRLDGSPRPAIHIRISAALKAELERDAKAANHSLNREIQTRLQKSYLSNELYGGSQMAAMFREMAAVASGVGQDKSGSFFDDFEVFIYIKELWEGILELQMPRPDDRVLDEVRGSWDASNAGASQTPARSAARQWLIRQALSKMTLAQILAGTFEPAIGKPPGTSEPASDGEIAALASAPRRSAPQSSGAEEDTAPGTSAAAVTGFGNLGDVMNAARIALEISQQAQSLAGKLAAIDISMPPTPRGAGGQKN